MLNCDKVMGSKRTMEALDWADEDDPCYEGLNSGGPDCLDGMSTGDITVARHDI